MNTAVVPTKSFQERMFERVREQMGDLMTDEELKKIVDQAMQMAFFQERVIKNGYNDERKPPLFVELLMKMMLEPVTKAIQQWLEANPEAVKQILDDVVKGGIAKAVLTTLDNRMQGPLWNFAEQLKQKGIFL